MPAFMRVCNPQPISARCGPPSHHVQLTELVLTATQRHGVFIFGIDCIPDTWSQLSNLRSLEVGLMGAELE